MRYEQGRLPLDAAPSRAVPLGVIEQGYGQDSDAVNTTMPIAMRTAEMAVTLSPRQVGEGLLKEFGASRIIQPDNNIRPHVVQDAETGNFVKLYPSPLDGWLQFTAMNLLHERLAQTTVGVTAVQHYALVGAAGEFGPVAAIIQSATGEPTYNVVSEDKQAYILDRVQKRVGRAIGDRACHTLVNDIADGGLFLRTHNIFDNDGIYTLIDQPHRFSNTSARQIIDTLMRLGAPNINLLKRRAK